MKKLILFAYCTCLLIPFLNAQVSKTVPPDAIAFYDKVITIIKPQLKIFINRKSITLRDHNANADSLKKKFRNEILLKTMNNNDIDGIIVIVLVQAYRQADDDLKRLVMAISRGNYNYKNGQNTARPVSVGSKSFTEEDLKQIENQKIQLIIDKKNQIAQEADYLINRISGLLPDIINHLK
jgi:hypothetical protein